MSCERTLGAIATASSIERPSLLSPVSTCSAQPPAHRCDLTNRSHSAISIELWMTGRALTSAKACRGSRVQPTENINRRVWRNRANTLGFRNIGDKKCPTAGFGQRARDRFDAAAIGVAFDHGGAFNLGVFRQSFPIGYNSRQIDLENTASLCFRRPIGRNTCRMRFIVNNEPAPSIYDFSVDRTFDNDLRARLDCQIGQKISTNV